MLGKRMEDVSQLVASQYEAYCYPEPVGDLAEPIGRSEFMYGDPSLFSAQLWPEGRPRADLRILIAGCGTNQAAWFAYTNPGCHVTGIDLSGASLAHERFLQEKHGLKNLRLFQGDLRQVGEIGNNFDLIVSTGVLHHLSDPDSGLRALASVLAPEGCMVIMLYGRRCRAGVYIMQDAVRRLGLHQTSDDIAVVRQLLDQLSPGHYFNWYRRVAPDLQFDSGIVDTLLHPQDRAYTVPEVLEFVQHAGLAFQGWLDNGLYYPVGTFPAGSAMRQRLAALHPHDQWAVVEDVTLRPARHFFIACHRSRVERTLIDFLADEWRGYVPVRHPKLQVVEEPSTDPDRFGTLRREQMEWAFTAAEAVLIREAQGRRSIQEIVSLSEFDLHAPEARIGFARRVFSRMWELGNMFMTKPAAGA
jgi:SAM-dependent methyltransferase